MTIDYRKRGQVTIKMYKYIEKTLNELPLDMVGIEKTQPQIICVQ